jgi:hypothetical protein
LSRLHTTHDYIIGNGVTDEQINDNALIPFVHGMGLIPDELFEEVNRECDGYFYNSLSDNCTNKLAKIDEDINGLNIYNFWNHAIMTHVFHLRGVKRGQDQLDTRLLMNGGHGYPMVKLLDILKDMTTILLF